MSLDQAKAFIAKMESDDAFRERVKSIGSVAERFEFIKSEGFDCSQEEINQISAPLSLEDLDAAAGGGGTESRYTIPEKDKWEE